MKKSLKCLACGLLAVCCVAGIASTAACKDNNGGGDNSQSVITSSVESAKKEKLVLNFSVLEMAVEEYLQLTVSGKEGAPTWSSSNPQVVSVSETGALLALTEGKATITVKVGDLEAVCNVTVVSTGIVVGMEFPDFDNEKVDLLAGSTFRINPKMTLKGNEVTYYSFTYTIVGADGVVSVNEDGVITAIQKGTVFVTVRAKHNVTGNVSEQKTIQVTVK